MYILVDRSGSMESIASDVIGGFNQTVAEQAQNGPDAKLTVIQFDSQDPQDVTIWGAPLPEITHLDSQTFVPRGGTPLLDATGLLIGRTMVDQSARLAAGLRAEDIIFVTITDGEENQSREFNLAQIRELIEKRTEEGWAFIYLSAGIDAYADAAQMGIHSGDTQQWKRDGKNARLAWSSTSDAVSNMREKKRRKEDTVRGTAFETGKHAEEDDQV
jgi:Mg-chelatase subunit ChlD